MNNNKLKYNARSLSDFALNLLISSGLTNPKASSVAEILLEGDLLGHTTHGLQLLPGYLKELSEGRMERDGEPAVLNDGAAALLWDGRYLPGPWLVQHALDEVFARAARLGSASAVIRRSGHIGALAAYLKRATDRGIMLLLTCSDPSVSSVAPHGAAKGVYTPNPIAAGFPTAAGPVWMDVSASTTTNGMVGRTQRLGGKLPGKWLVDRRGEATDDPAAMSAILPLGGLDLGHKGFALGLLVEALTAGLGGFGRADGETRWGASVFMLALDPRAFGGEAAFARETGWLAQACRDAGASVRLPGERAQMLRASQLRTGVALHPETLPALAPWAGRFGIALPQALE
jgi:L-lactate dehydrogenase